MTGLLLLLLFIAWLICLACWLAYIEETPAAHLGQRAADRVDARVNAAWVPVVPRQRKPGEWE
jgi:hypothetical protein